MSFFDALISAPARSGMATRLHGLWQHLQQAGGRWQRAREVRRELALLDDHTLRDLGLHRSEYYSYVAEAAGAAEQTRRRIGGWSA